MDARTNEETATNANVRSKRSPGLGACVDYPSSPRRARGAGRPALVSVGPVSRFRAAGTK
eukprot:15448047-Alexandrium_andersonii.AAC.1